MYDAKIDHIQASHDHPFRDGHGKIAGQKGSGRNIRRPVKEAHHSPRSRYGTYVSLTLY